MRAKSNLFQINGVPMLAQDAEVVSGFEDLDASDAGRDESGFMHRIVGRYKVGSWKFEYSHLTEEEKAEQATLRRLYIDSFKESLEGQLSSITVVEKDGSRHKLEKKQ